MFSFSTTAIHKNIFFNIVTEPLITMNVFRNVSLLKLLSEDSNKKKLPEKLMIKATDIQKIAF